MYLNHSVTTQFRAYVNPKNGFVLRATSIKILFSSSPYHWHTYLSKSTIAGLSYKSILHVELGFARIDTVLSKCSAQVFHRQCCPRLVLPITKRSQSHAKIKVSCCRITLEDPGPESGWLVRARPPVAFVRIRAC